MPTQPVVWTCKANVMVSPLTEYVTLYAPFAEDLLPKHMSASTSTKHVLDQCVHVHQTSPSTVLVTRNFTKSDEIRGNSERIPQSFFAAIRGMILRYPRNDTSLSAE